MESERNEHSESCKNFHKGLKNIISHKLKDEGVQHSFY